MKLTVVGCSGSFPSAESACSSYLVEADGFRLLLDMGNGALGELQRHAVSTTSTRSCSATSTPTTASTCAATSSPATTGTRAAVRADPGLRPGGHRAAADHRLRGHPLRAVDERGLRLPHPEARQPSSIGPFTVRTDEGRPPGGGVRLPDRARRPDARRTRVTPAPARSWTASPPAPTSSCARRPSRTARRTSPASTSTAGRPASRPGAPAWDASSSPTSRRGPTPRSTSATPGTSSTARSNSPSRRRVRGVAAYGVQAGPRRLRDVSARPARRAVAALAVPSSSRSPEVAVPAAHPVRSARDELLDPDLRRDHRPTPPPVAPHRPLQPPRLSR